MERLVDYDSDSSEGRITPSSSKLQALREELEKEKAKIYLASLEKDAMRLRSEREEYKKDVNRLRSERNRLKDELITSQTENKILRSERDFFEGEIVKLRSESKKVVTKKHTPILNDLYEGKCKVCGKEGHPFCCTYCKRLRHTEEYCFFKEHNRYISTNCKICNKEGHLVCCTFCNRTNHVEEFCVLKQKLLESQPEVSSSGRYFDQEFVPLNPPNKLVGRITKAPAGTK